MHSSLFLTLQVCICFLVHHSVVIASATPLEISASQPSPLPLPPPDLQQFVEDDFEEEISLVGYNRPLLGVQSYWPFGEIDCRRLSGNGCGDTSVLEYGLAARAFYLNDQRIQWSGLEATFAAEGALLANYRRRSGQWTTFVEGELFFNQPSDENIFLNSPERASYAANYDFDPVEFSRLNVGIRRGNWEMRAGKMWTPFGRYYTQLWSNQLLDAPFIRTEAINFRETGILFRWYPSVWVIDAGVFNGHEDRDANSSKGLVARIGAERESWALGTSIKMHDGYGSEDQKTYKNHVGIDAMVKQGPWRVSGEVIYDQYGLRHSSFDPLDIFWKKSLYYRDLNKADDEPITGGGYYVTVDYTGELWTASLSFGQFFPEYIGNVQHDRTQNRGVIKLARSFGRNLQSYTVLLLENEGYLAQSGRPRRGEVLLSGLQYTF